MSQEEMWTKMPGVDMCSALIRKRKCQRLVQHMTLSKQGAKELKEKEKKNKEEKSAKDIRITRGHSSVWWMQ